MVWWSLIGVTEAAILLSPLSGWTVDPLAGTEAGLDLDFIDVALLFLWRLRLLR